MPGVRVVHTKAEVRAWSREVRMAGQRSALVPTLGSLHRGHASLVNLATGHADRVALSIFVNPLQFGPQEDFERYPRDLEGDLKIAESAGAELVFAPSVAEMYPQGEPWVAAIPERGADVLCGRSRPGHFRGVLTVVAKLFGIFTPDMAAFGQKDYQQLTLIRRMVTDLDMPVQVLAGPTVREADGLAMSSRNRYLSSADRALALELSAALRACASMFASGEREAEIFRQRLAAAARNGIRIEYAEVVDPDLLSPLERVTTGSVCAIAAHVGKTRLIDNHILGDDSP
jgi:pantoate--beta-alanine ligase